MSLRAADGLTQAWMPLGGTARPRPGRLARFADERAEDVTGAQPDIAAGDYRSSR